MKITAEGEDESVTVIGEISSPQAESTLLERERTNSEAEGQQNEATEADRFQFIRQQSKVRQSCQPKTEKRHVVVIE
jgi:hypothetical protein